MAGGQSGGLRLHSTGAWGFPMPCKERIQPWKPRPGNPASGGEKERQKEVGECSGEAEPHNQGKAKPIHASASEELAAPRATVRRTKSMAVRTDDMHRVKT